MRFGKQVALGALLGSGFAGSAQAEKAPVVLEPSSQWHVDFGEERCRLARVLGEGENRHLIFFEQWGPQKKFGFTVSGPAFERFHNRKPTQLRFLPHQKNLEIDAFKGDVGSFGPALIYSSVSLSGDDDVAIGRGGTSLPELDTHLAKQVRSILINQGKREVALQTGDLGDAFTLMNQCAQDLLNDWGVDLEAHKTATKLPVWTNEKVISRRIIDNYPRKALNRGEQGIMRMRVMVDEVGAVTNCVIDKATLTQSLESPACKAMYSATFEPALDNNGKPMESFYITGIKYQISN